jgi:transcription-repair coupling factor (superfamily II helicase)
LRLLGKPLGVVKLDAGAASIQLQLTPNPPIDPADIILLTQREGQLDPHHVGHVR